MQSMIQEPGIVTLVYQCNNCPNGCELHDKQTDTKGAASIHQQHCHHFPSLMTAWKLKEA